MSVEEVIELVDSMILFDDGYEQEVNFLIFGDSFSSGDSKSPKAPEITKEVAIGVATRGEQVT